MVNFTLTGLNSDVGLVTSPQYPTARTITVTDISSAFIATIEISKSNVESGGGGGALWKYFSLNNLFYFKTTDPELTGTPGTVADASDMEFKCVASNWPTILFSEAVVSSGKESVDIYSNSLKVPFTHDPVGYPALASSTKDGNNYRINSIGPARLAFQITGGYNNSDIFANEEALREQYFNLDTSGNVGDINNGIKQKIEEKLSTAEAGSDGAPSSNNEDGTGNITREILLTLLNGTASDIQRVHTMISDASGATVDSDGNVINAGDTSNLWIPILFAVGDTITFRITYKVENIQDASTEAAKDSAGNILGSGKITDQEFQMKVVIVA